MKPRVISGKVSLPDGVAPSGGISLNIAIFNETDGNSQIITIPAGKSSATYSISVPPNDRAMSIQSGMKTGRTRFIQPMDTITARERPIICPMHSWWM